MLTVQLQAHGVFHAETQESRTIVWAPKAREGPSAREQITRVKFYFAHLRSTRSREGAETVAAVQLYLSCNYLATELTQPKPNQRIT